MSTRKIAIASAWTAAWVASWLAACGSTKSPTTPKNPDVDSFTNASKCQTGKNREVTVRDMSGTGRPDTVEVREFSEQVAGQGLTAHVVCTELDTNHDGALDVIRTYKASGELDTEEADTNYDGKSDVWIYYDQGLIAKAVFDRGFTGKANEWDYYQIVETPDHQKTSVLKRIERDRNGDGEPDVWEYYVNGHLERMGVDETFTSHRVTAWLRDNSVRSTSGATVEAAPSTTASASASTSAKKHG
jgi:hypothetical protein